MKTKKLNKCFFFMSLLVFAAACEDKLIYPPSGNGNSVKFSLENMSEKNALSRSFSDGGSLLPSGIVPLEAEDRTLYLHTSVSEGVDGSRLGKDEAVTRATPVSNMNTYGSFAVFAASYRGAWSPGSQNMNFMYHVPVSLSGGVWSPPADYHWPGSGHKVRFFAYAPIDAEFEASNQSAVANDFHIKYDVPADVSRQKDLLVAKSAEYPGNHGNSVPLQFKHVLTAVRFVVGDDMKAGTVNKIRLRNIASAGMYDPETGIGQASGTVKDFEQELNKVTGGTPGTAITEPFQTFMLPPQSFNDDSSVIEVVFTDDEGEHTLTASLKGQTWISGTTVTYTISTSSINWNYTLVVAPTADFNYTGGTQQYSVISYKQNSKGNKQPAQWKAQFSTDNGASWTDAPPEWLTDFTASGAGGTTPQSYNATVGAQIGRSNDPHTQKLRDNPSCGGVIYHHNLANQTDGGSTNENTANCYVVSGSGYYCFPLVYGNAIKNGMSNTPAYTSTKTGSDILTTFINHTGNPITSPYIKENAGCVPAKAELLWQDAPGLISNVQYNNSLMQQFVNPENYISFRVNALTIRQGNAVIAIKDASDAILWSWHIWVTDENIGQTIEVTNHQSQKYKFMPVNLGWCDDRTETYAERSCKVKFTAGDASKEVIIKQASASITTAGNHPYYEWGRKDPFPPSNGLSDTNKTWYDKDGNAHTENPKTEDFSYGVTCIMNYILKPDVMYRFHYGDYKYANLWSTDNNVYTANDENVIKTIYDPSPVGFKVPPSNAFTGFTTTGDEGNTPSQINGEWDSYLKGWFFFTDASRNKTIFFPASGWRLHYSGEVASVGSIGFYWTAVPSNQIDAFSMECRPLFVIPSDSHRNRPYGFGVRSSQE